MSQKKISDLFSREPKASSSGQSNFASNESAPKSEQVLLMKNEERAKKLPKIGDKPYQPNISFKKREFSGFKRNFQYKWFADFPWIHYNELEDIAYCFHCVKCIKFDRISRFVLV